MDLKSSIFRKRGRHYWRNLALFTLASLFIGLLFIQFVAMPVIYAYRYSHPQRLAVCCYTPSDLGLPYEDAAFVTSDRLTIRGWYLPSQNRAAVILIHPGASNRMGTMEGAKLLARHGYGVLLIDARAHGESDGETLPYGGPEGEDVRAAATYLRSRADVDPERIGVMGWSLGAQIGIIGAARTPEIKAVVADAPGATAFEDWPPPQSLREWLYFPMDFVFYQAMPFFTGVSEPLSLLKAVEMISPRPLLFINGGPESEQRSMKRFLDAAGEPKTLWIIPEAGHIEGLIKRPAEYEERVVVFFDQALR